MNRNDFTTQAQSVMGLALRSAMSRGAAKVDVDDIEHGLSRYRLTDTQHVASGGAGGLDLICTGCSWTGTSWNEAKQHIIDVLRDDDSSLSHCCEPRVL